MDQRTILIKVQNKGIYLNPELLIPIAMTNIPSGYLTFSDRQEIYWEVNMLRYAEENESLRVSVTDYKPLSISTFVSQKPKKAVSQVLFEKFDWGQLEPFLISYQKSQLLEVLENIDANPFSFAKSIKEPSVHTKTEQPKSQGFFNIPPVEETFHVPFNECQLKLGYVLITKELPALGKRVDIKILNDAILPEFDAIKPWFAKKLGVKRIKVTVIINSNASNEISIKASSPQVDQINQELIDGIKYQRTLALTSEPNISFPDKSLFSADDVFSSFDEDPQGNVFVQSENDILSLLADNEKIRNRSQLVYLAGKKQSVDHKLRFTLSPDFGFLFFVEGEECNHFVWELLNSNATYIWSIDKDQDSVSIQYKRIENAINSVRAKGRTSYKNAYRENHIDADLVFNVINHKHIGSNFIDSFPRWKSKLNELLV